MATAKETEDLAKISNLLKNLGAKLDAVNTSVTDIKGSIVDKGVAVPAGTKLSDYDDKIKMIKGSEDVDYSDIIAELTALGTKLDTINGEVITATT